MTIEQLRQMHHARPFRPFRVHMADGRHLDVDHPEFLAHTPAGRTIMVARPDESFEVIDLLLVTSLEPINGERQLGTE
ncbi:MAG: hypothetical protein V3W34_13440 [Phycisphaerae bacterium]